MAAIERRICHKNDAWDKVTKEVSLERLRGRQMKKKFVVVSFFLKKVKKTVVQVSVTKTFPFIINAVFLFPFSFLNATN